MLFFCKVLTSEGRYRWCCGCARSCQGVLRKLLQARRYPQFVVPVHLGLMDRRASRDKINMSLRLWFTLLERIVLVMQSGRTLMQALHSLTLTSLHPLQGTFVTRTVQTLRSGQFFYEIMRQLLPRRIVSERHAYLVQCAELGGYLTDGLNCLLEHIRLKLKIQKQALSCCIYPAFIVLIGTFVLFFIVSYILPQFREFFEAQAIDVPKLRPRWAPQALERLVLRGRFYRSYLTLRSHLIHWSRPLLSAFYLELDCKWTLSKVAGISIFC